MTIHDFLTSHKKELSNYRIAKEIGVSETNIKKIFSGETSPKATTFFLICKVMEVPIKEIASFAKDAMK